MAFSHASDDITLGRGEVYFDPFTTDTNRTGEFKYMGNTPAVALAASTTKLDHFSSDRGLRVKDKSVVLEVNYTGTLETDNMDFGNLAKFFMGTTTLVEQAAGTGLTQSWTTVADKTLLQLGVTDANPQGDRDVTSVVVTSDGDPMTLGTHYELDADTGRVHTLVAFVTMTVDYVISTSTREQVISAGTQVKGALRVIAENSEGTNRDYYLPNVTLAPNGDFVLKGDGTNWLSMKLDMEVLKKDDSTAAIYIDGRAA